MFVNSCKSLLPTLSFLLHNQWLLDKLISSYLIRGLLIFKVRPKLTRCHRLLVHLPIVSDFLLVVFVREVTCGLIGFNIKIIRGNARNLNLWVELNRINLAFATNWERYKIKIALG